MTPASLHSETTDPQAIGKKLLQRSYNSDGLPEISMGLFCLLFASLNYATTLLPADSAGFKVTILTLTFLPPLFVLASRWALRWVRRRYLIERFGYVQYKPIYRGLQQMGPRIALILLAATVTVILGVVTRLLQVDSWPRWLLAGTGLFGGAIFAGIGQPRRMVIYGIVMAATGLSLAFLAVPASPGAVAWLNLRTGMAILFGVLGVVTLVTGVVVFLRFMGKPVEARD